MYNTVLLAFALALAYRFFDLLVQVLVPWAMSRQAEVHPMVSLFAIILFGRLFGFLGLLLAIPIVLLNWTLVQVLWVERTIHTGADRIAPVVEE